MPNISMTRVLFNPRFATTIVVERNEQIVDQATGLVSVSVVEYPASAVVTSGPDNSLLRGSDVDQQPKTIVVHTSFKLRGPSEDFGGDWKPDVVRWHASRFMVGEVKDWTEFGDGFVAATCASVVRTDVPPGVPSEPT